MDNLDIIEQIGKHCDAKTHLNLCLASKEYHSYNRGVLYEREKQTFIDKTQKLMNQMPYKWTFHARLRHVHKILRNVIIYKHVLNNPDCSRLREVIRSKLTEFGTSGMSQRKVRYYQKTLQL